MSDFFPEEVIEDILLRLPINSLLQCRAVCKSWRSLIQTSAFIHTHLLLTVESSNRNDTHLLLLNSLAEKQDTTGKLGELFSLHWDKPAFGEYTKLINPFIYDNTACFPKKRTVLGKNFHVVGTCNGLICLAANFATIIWNPCVRKFVFLPRSRISFPADDIEYLATYAFGYDSCANDYNVLRMVSNGQTPCEAEVWSLARGSWKRLSAAVIPADFRPAGGTARDIQPFVNGVPHWLQSYKNKDNCIVWFDMASELFGKILVPDALRRKKCFMSRYGESLALFESVTATHYEASGGSNQIIYIHMWVMKEFGVAESWTKLLSICLEGIGMEPLGLIKNGEVLLFRMYGGVLVSLDPNTKQVKYFEVDGYKYYVMDSFVESIVLLDQSSAISY